MQLRLKIIFGVLLFSLLLMPTATKAADQSIPRCDQLLEQYNNGTLKSTWLDDYYQDNLSWTKIRDEFHKEMDSRFKEKIQDMTGNDKIPKKCGECQSTSESITNASFGKFVLEEKDPPKGVLLETQEYQCVLYFILQNQDYSDIADSENWNTETTQLFTQYKSLKSEIAQEIETTGVAMRIAIDSLGEMQTAYLVHKRLVCIIACLQETRSALKDYLEQAVRIPGKFLNCGYES